ncbi:proline racemase family [Penicillium argentinense]|uniref:Proline racemase family n=1 Tax=Penicillium argentinense TaxID=1131581 RepID=A0A9W9G665_9EURO|nr:proline racemase family [Penicillium argentinense]KAJ5112810.1 proline racemase family [Penicillium argentinense]
MSVVACHAEGEACDVVVGGIPHVRGQTMLHKQIEFMSHHEWRRDQLLNEPRGRCGLNAVFLLPPCSLGAKCGLLFAKNDEYVPVSVSSMIAAAHVIVNGPDAEIDRLKIPTTRFTFDTIAGAVDVDVNLKRESSNGFNIPKCQAVTVHGIPSFVFGLDYELDLYGLGQISIDVAYGGVICAFVDADSVGVSIHDGNGQKMIEIGERIKNALRELHDFVHPVQADLHGVSTVVFTDRVDRDNSGSNTRKKTNMAAVISPGRLDRSPSGTAVFARLAVLYARGDISKETLSCQSIIGTRLYGRIRGKTMVDKYEAILPSVTGRAWIHSLKQVGMNPGDPFPEGFRGADQWGPDEYKRGRTVTYDPHNLELPSGW